MKNSVKCTWGENKSISLRVAIWKISRLSYSTWEFMVAGTSEAHFVAVFLPWG